MKTLDRKKSSDEGNAIDPNLNTKEMQRFRDFPIEIQLKIVSHFYTRGRRYLLYILSVRVEFWSLWIRCLTSRLDSSAYCNALYKTVG